MLQTGSALLTFYAYQKYKKKKKKENNKKAQPAAGFVNYTGRGQPQQFRIAPKWRNYP